MAKSANVFTRVDPALKEQADSILNKLGISMSTAMGMFLQQIVLQRGIPFEVKLPENEPISYVSLSDIEFDGLMDEALDSDFVPIEKFQADIKKELGL